MGNIFTVLEPDDTVIATGMRGNEAARLADEKPGRQLLDEECLLVKYISE